MAGCRRKHSFRPSTTTGASHWNRTATAAAATRHRSRDRCSRARIGPTRQDERSKGHALNGETEETGSAANNWETKQVGEEDTDSQIDRENGGWSCDQTRCLITPRAPVRSHLSRRRWGRFRCNCIKRDGSQGASHPLSHLQSQCAPSKPLIPLTKLPTYDPNAGSGTGSGTRRERPPAKLRFAAPAGVPSLHLPVGSLPPWILPAEGRKAAAWRRARIRRCRRSPRRGVRAAPCVRASR